MNIFKKEVVYPTTKRFGDLSAGDAFYLMIDENTGGYGLYLKVFDKDAGCGNDGAFFAIDLMKWCRKVLKDDQIVYPVDLRIDITAKADSPWNNSNTALPILTIDSEIYGCFIYAEDGSDDYHLFAAISSHRTGNNYVDMMTGQMHHQNHFPNVVFLVDANVIVMSGDKK